jgi:hypothetical protein
MRRLLQIAQFPLFIAFNFFLLLTVYQIVGKPGKTQRLGLIIPTYDHKEEYDPSLERLNTVSKVVAYCDSLYDEALYKQPSLDFAEEYPEIASSVIRRRFFHGYSSYDLSNNYLGGLVARFSMRGLSAIVIADDILKYPYAACSQQSIVMMDVLQQKGFKTRKIAFVDKRGGHFCFETYYDGGWHFYDPDMEPDIRVLNAYQRPGIAFITKHKDVLLNAYRQYPQQMILNLFSVYEYGKVNDPAAPNAFIFQKVTKFLSYTIWTFFLVLFILVRRKYLQLSARKNVWNNRIHVPELQPATPGVFNLEY